MITAFFDIKIEEKEIGKITFRLFKGSTPKTIENFKQLCNGQNEYGYKGSVFHRIIPNFVIQGGDITNHNGTGGKSIYGEGFVNELSNVKHTKPGLLCMANNEENKNLSQFFITTVTLPCLDDKYTVFGEVIEGFSIVKLIESLGSQSGIPKKKVIINECGINEEEEPEVEPDQNQVGDEDMNMDE